MTPFKGWSYSMATLETAVSEIRRGLCTLGKASITYRIPKSTLYTRLHRKRGDKNTTKGRRALLPTVYKTKNYVKVRESWGYEQCTNLDVTLIREKGKKMLTFKPMNGSFERFMLLRSTLDSLELRDKPALVWSLNEMTIRLDNYISNEIGELRRSGADVVSMLTAGNAAGGKAPPLLVFKGTKVLERWKAEVKYLFPGTFYAATVTGFMDGEVFFKYLEKKFIPFLGPQRPAIIIFDGHSNHVTVKIIELAMKNNIVLLKLPIRTQNLLDPLDNHLSKSMKASGTSGLTRWQRKFTLVREQKITKRQISNIFETTWRNVKRCDIVENFKKAGNFNENINLADELNFPGPSTSRAVTEDISSVNNSDQCANEKTSQIVDDTNINEEESNINIIENTKETCKAIVPQTKSIENIVNPELKSINSGLCSTNEKKIVVSDEELNCFRISDAETPCITISDSESNCMTVTDDECGDIIYSPFVGSFILATFEVHNSKTYQIGEVLKINKEGYLVKFLKKCPSTLDRNNYFFWPDILDVSTVFPWNIKKLLPKPKRVGSSHFILGQYEFEIDLKKYRIR